MAWIVAHQGVCAGVVVAILDLVFAVSPAASGSGILHQLYVFLGGKKGL